MSWSLCLDQALPQTSPRSQGCVAVPVIKLLVPHVCKELCRERHPMSEGGLPKAPPVRADLGCSSRSHLGERCPQPLSLSLLLSVTCLETLLGQLPPKWLLQVTFWEVGTSPDLSAFPFHCRLIPGT